MPQQPNRSARIEARISPEALALIRRAAEIQGRSISDFVVAAAWEAANKTMENSQIVRLSMQAQERFAKLLLHPPEPTEALENAYSAHRSLIEP